MISTKNNRFDSTNIDLTKSIIEHSFSGFKVNSIEILGAGFDSVAYLVNNEYIFKRSKHKESAENMKKEISVLRYIEGKLPLETPKIEFYDENKNICGYKIIKGTILTPKIYLSMSSEEQQALAKDIANFLLSLHSLSLPNIEDLEQIVIEDYKKDYEILKEKVYDKIPKETKDYLEELFHRILNDERITKYSAALCHSDLSCNHIIIKDNKAVGIIDFGDISISDKDKDFVYLLEDSDEELGREFGLKVLEYYNHQNKDIALLKADLNEEYYYIKEIVWGIIMPSKELFDEGLNEIKKRTTN